MDVPQQAFATVLAVTVLATCLSQAMLCVVVTYSQPRHYDQPAAISVLVQTG